MTEPGLFPERIGGSSAPHAVRQLMRQEPPDRRDFRADKGKSGQVYHQPGHAGGPVFLPRATALLCTAILGKQLAWRKTPERGLGPQSYADSSKLECWD